MKYFCIRILDTQCMIFKYIYVNKIDFITIIILCGGRVGSIGMLTLITYWPETLFSLSFSLKGFIYGSHLLHALNTYKWLILRITAGYSAKSIWKHICAVRSKNFPDNNLEFPCTFPSFQDIYTVAFTKVWWNFLESDGLSGSLTHFPEI